jgi:hypothetical protein
VSKKPDRRQNRVFVWQRAGFGIRRRAADALPLVAWGPAPLSYPQQLVFVALACWMNQGRRELMEYLQIALAAAVAAAAIAALGVAARWPRRLTASAAPSRRVDVISCGLNERSTPRRPGYRSDEKCQGRDSGEQSERSLDVRERARRLQSGATGEFTRSLSKSWRRRPDLNRGWRFCRPRTSRSTISRFPTRYTAATTYEPERTYEGVAKLRGMSLSQGQFQGQSTRPPSDP